MNKVILMGRMTKDLELRYGNTQNGQLAIGNGTIAVDRPGRDKGADFINFTAFGKNAEAIQKYFPKGRKILLEGSWTTGDYTNKDGQKVYTNNMSVSRFEFVDSKSAENATPQPQGNAAPQPQGNAAPQPQQQGGNYPQQQAPAGQNDFIDIPYDLEDELPFN